MKERNMYRILRLIYSYRTTMFASIYLLSKRFFIKAKNSDECVGYLIIVLFFIFGIFQIVVEVCLCHLLLECLSLSLSPPAH